MHMRHFYASLALGLMGFSALADNSVCEYWLDFDYANRGTAIVTDSTASMQLDIRALSPGLHYFSLWPKNGSNGPGSVMRTAFFTTSSETKTSLSAIEYWLNNDYATRVRRDLSADSVAVGVDLKHLPLGMHFFNCRAIDNVGDFGPVMRTMLFISSVTEPAVKSTYCETWLDNDFDSRQSIQVSEADSIVALSHDISGMSQGMHFFNYRAVGATPGPVMRTMFYVPKPSQPDVAAIKYWIDSRDTTVVRTRDCVVTIDLNLDGLAWGEHTFHLVAEDSWGNPGEEFAVEFALKDASEVAEDAEWQLLVALHDQLVAQGWAEPWDMSCGPEGAYNLRGVTITRSHVVDLLLPGEEINGEFPTAALAFPNLKRLDLSNNSLLGPLPSGGAKIGEITSIDLSHNNLDGNAGTMAERFPALTKLDLSYNKISQVSPMISPTVTSLYLGNQRMDYVADMDISRKESLLGELPTIVTYDHEAQTYHTDYKIALESNGWEGLMSGNESEYLIVATGDNPVLKATDEDIISALMGGHTFGARILYQVGDANLDGELDVADLQSTILYIFESTPSLFTYSAADVWCDKTINVQDVAALAHNLANRHIKPTILRSPQEDVLCYVDHGQLMLSSAVDVAAFDIVVDNSTVCDFSRELRERGFVTKENYDDGQLHIVAYSLNGADIPAGITKIAVVEKGNVAYSKLVDEQANVITSPAEGASICDAINSWSISVVDRNLIVNTDVPLNNVTVTLIGTDGRMSTAIQVGLVNVGRTVIPVDCERGIYIVKVETSDTKPIFLKTAF